MTLSQMILASLISCVCGANPVHLLFCKLDWNVLSLGKKTVTQKIIEME